MNIQVRIPSGLVKRLLDEVYRHAVREPVVFALASHAHTVSRELILVQDIIIPPESAFLSSRGHGARWKGAYTIELLNRALDKQLGLFIVHAHPGVRNVQMSGDDIGSARALLPKFQLVFPQRPHGSIVLGHESVAGQILMPDSDQPIEEFEFRLIDGEGIRTWPTPNATEGEQLLLQRQPLTDNPLRRKIFKGNVVAIVGLSGGGSQVAPYLAGFGVGEIIGIDNQRADESNRFASPNLGWIDSLLKLRKTFSTGLRVKLVNLNVKFTGIKARVPEREALEAIKRADVIVGCVNNLHARADLIEIAWRYCIPYVDIGLRMTTSENHQSDPKPLLGIPGNLFTAIPGGPCLWCSGFLDQKKLDGETGGRGRSYLQGSDDGDAFVSPFNGVLAGEAAAEVLRLLAGLKHGREARRQYDGIAGTLLEVIVSQSKNCRICRSMLAAGDPIWQPAMN